MRFYLYSQRFVICFGAILAGFSHALAAEDPLQFNRDIRPILADNCFACHGLDAIARQADLRLDDREAAIGVGAILPGDSQGSELIARVFSTDPDMVMPPPDSHKSLTADQRKKLRRWIDEGATYQAHWSFIVPARTALPSVSNKDWPNNGIDHYVLARLEQNGLTPEPEAEPAVLFRRVHLDITGLPPTPEELTRFVADYRTRGHDALSDWIDRLMQRPTWGEHRARYWLDAARYGDTHGLHFDNYREIWPYRDWVIRAFNANQPFDRFVIEQLAGDLLDNPTRDQLVATGFQRCCITTNEGGTIDEENLAIYAADRVQTFGWVFMGLTTNCCQCHDHKFDPLTMKDYYSLAAFFRNTTQPAKDGNEKKGGGPSIVLPNDEDLPRYQSLPAEIEALATELDERRNAAEVEYGTWLANDATELTRDLEQIKSKVAHFPLDAPLESNVPELAGVSVVGNVDWTETGLLGPAPKLNTSGTLKLGDVGDFAFEQPFTAGAWVKTANKNTAAIIARMDNQHGHRGWDIFQNSDSFAVHIIDQWPDNALKVVIDGAAVRTGEWQHVMFSWDGSGKVDGITMYLDGEPKATRTAKNTLQEGASINTDVPLRAGQRQTSSHLQGGSVQDVRLYNRVLTPEEIRIVAQLGPIQRIIKVASGERTSEEDQRLYDYYLKNHDRQFMGLTRKRQSYQDELDAIIKRSPVTLVQEEKADSPAMAHVLIRGSYDQPGEKVTADTPAALPGMPDAAPKNRLGLADWVVDSTNPLTARVTVNRFWQELFGKGLVATPEDFGVMGASPTHPQLLDWLAVEFQDGGWDVKRLFKLMMMSATYRQAATVTPEKLEKDRDNDLISRGPRFRMDGEMIRDCALSASGLLSQKMYGPPVRPYQPENIWDIVGLPGGDTREYKQDMGESLYRRSLYTFWKRMAPPPALESFNAPSREVCTVRRERTNTPLQALVTLNDPQYVEAARRLAQRVLLEKRDSDKEVLNHIALLVMGRSLNVEEMRIALDSKQRLAEHFEQNQEAAAKLIHVGESAPAAALTPTLLATWTMVCNQFLNLDEALTK